MGDKKYTVTDVFGIGKIFSALANMFSSDSLMVGIVIIACAGFLTGSC